MDYGEILSKKIEGEEASNKAASTTKPNATKAKNLVIEQLVVVQETHTTAETPDNSTQNETIMSVVDVPKFNEKLEVNFPSCWSVLYSASKAKD